LAGTFIHAERVYFSGRLVDDISNYLLELLRSVVFVGSFVRWCVCLSLIHISRPAALGGVNAVYRRLALLVSGTP